VNRPSTGSSSGPWWLRSSGSPSASRSSSLVGLTVIAGALGTATGFLALGVSYALSGMLADAVAGVYLLRDPDFQPGDTVTVDDVTGEVVAIELRKTRLPWRATRWSGRTRDIEQEWRKDGQPAG